MLWRKSLIAAVLLALLAITGGSARAEGPNAIIGSAGCGTNALPANDDGSTDAVAMPFTINFFGNSFNQLWVNNNGNVTFNGPLEAFTPSPIGANAVPIIAPFWADVDTRGVGSGTTQYGPISAGDIQVGGHAAFCVNWVDVGYYEGHTDKLNSFQLVLIDRSDTGAGNFDIEFNYDKVQWETGDASGGSGGLGGSSARVGYSNGSGASFELPGSATNGAFLDSNTTSGLIFNNVNSPLQSGRYIFPVRNGAATGHAISGHIWANAPGTPVSGAFVSACPTPDDTPCRLASTSADGSYALSNLPDHTSGGGSVDHDWNLTVNPPGASGLNAGTAGPITVNGADVPNADVTLHGPTPLPAGASITTDSRGTQTSGIPTIYWEDSITVHVTACAGGSGTATIHYSNGDTQTVNVAEGPSGVYAAVFAAPFPHHGNSSISWTISCGGPPSTGSFDLYIDPSGVVKTVSGDPISGATVTLFRSDLDGGPFVSVPNGSAIMSPGNQNNPDTTDAGGHFGWDVLTGFYVVRAEKTGCTSVDGTKTYQESAVLTIPPPVTDLDLRLDCSPASVPDAPTGVGATGGNGTATVTWTAPAGTGGRPLLGYDVTRYVNGVAQGTTSVGLVSQTTVTGLTNGTTYTFKVAAKNVVGTGTASGASNAVTPATVPDAPTGAAATAGNASAAVSWTPPAGNGGSAVTGYVVTPFVGGVAQAATTVGNVTSTTISGLANGTAVLFKVAAKNALGTGAQSGASNAVVPVTVPGSPTGITASGGNASATVTWTTPASNGGSSITGYVITPYIGTTAQAAVPVGVVTSTTITGLTNGTAYTFTVAARSAVGLGAASAASNAVTPATVPGAPTGVSATAARGSATVSWSAPADNGGSAVTGYVVTPYRGTTAQTTVAVSGMSTNVTGLTNGQTYTFTVAAVNAVGTGSASAASNAVTPKAPPQPPRCVVPNVRGKPLATAKKKITAAHCKTGKVTQVKSKTVGKSKVVSQKPKAGSKLKSGTKINLVVSRGKH